MLRKPNLTFGTSESFTLAKVILFWKAGYRLAYQSVCSLICHAVVIDGPQTGLKTSESEPFAHEKSWAEKLEQDIKQKRRGICAETIQEYILPLAGLRNLQDFM